MKISEWKALDVRNFHVLVKKEGEYFFTLPVDLLHEQFVIGKNSVLQKIRCNLCATEVIFHM